MKCQPGLSDGDSFRSFFAMDAGVLGVLVQGVKTDTFDLWISIESEDVTNNHL